VLVNPNDWTAFERVMGVPPRGIGAKTIAQLQEGVIRQGVEATLVFAARQHKGLGALLVLLDTLRSRMRGPAATLRTLIDRFDDLVEERRLLYGGLTRARTLLLLTVCHERMLWGRPWVFGPSPFLAEAKLGRTGGAPHAEHDRGLMTLRPRRRA